MTDTTRDLLISLASHMAYMQSQLEARHELDDPEDYYWYRESVLLRQKVTDELLADEPAVPEGREPAAVITEPSDEELRYIWETGHLPSDEELANDDGEQDLQFLYTIAYYRWLEENPDAMEEHEIKCIRAVFNAGRRWGNLKALLTSSPPADGEVAELVEWLCAIAADLRDTGFRAERLIRAAELLQRQVLVPVSVSERLPEAEDCDAEGRCWWGTPSFANNYIVTQSAQWRLCAPDDRFGSELLWLPAHALPLPEVNND